MARNYRQSGHKRAGHCVKVGLLCRSTRAFSRIAALETKARRAKNVRMTKYVLLDRDGVINRKVENGYVASWPEFVFLPGALEALRLLAENGYVSLVISNQAGVGKGVLTAAALRQITQRFMAKAKAHGGRISQVYYCTHRKEERCQCRKPKPGLLLRAQQDHGFQFTKTYLIGDSESDLLAARTVGCPAILINRNPARVRGKWASCLPTVVPDLRSAVSLVLEEGDHPA